MTARHTHHSRNPSPHPHQMKDCVSNAVFSLCDLSSLTLVVFFACMRRMFDVDGKTSGKVRMSGCRTSDVSEHATCGKKRER